MNRDFRVHFSFYGPNFMPSVSGMSQYDTRGNHIHGYQKGVKLNDLCPIGKEYPESRRQD